jgi:hypothetical protein
MARPAKKRPSAPKVEPIELPPPPDVPASLKRIAKQAPPPRAPVHARGDWAAAERELGTALPADFKAITELYGSGGWSELLFLFNPFDPGAANLFAQIRVVGAFDERLRTEQPEFAAKLFAHPPFPEPGGLLPFARDDASGVFYWTTRGEPDDWTVVQMARTPGRERVFDVGIRKLLERWLGLEVELFHVADEKFYFLPQPTGLRSRVEAVLSPAEAPLAKRASIVRRTIAGIAGPAHAVGEEPADDEDHFATAAHWLVGYSGGRAGGGPRLTIDVPPEHEPRLRPTIAAVAAATGASVESIEPMKRDRWA